MVKITPRDRKFLIAGGVAICIFILLKFIVIPSVEKVSSLQDDLVLKERTVEKYTKIISRQSELQKKLKLLKREQTKINNSLLTGGTPSLSAADIQKSIDRIATSSTIEIQSVKIMDSGKQDEFVTIPIQVRFTSDLRRMKNFVYGIETNQKLLTIPDLKISVRNRRDPKEVVVTMVVRGFMQKEAKS